VLLNKQYRCRHYLRKKNLEDTDERKFILNFEQSSRLHNVDENGTVVSTKKLEEVPSKTLDVSFWTTTSDEALISTKLVILVSSTIFLFLFGNR
jgi:hypothetical protein